MVCFSSNVHPNACFKNVYHINCIEDQLCVSPFNPKSDQPKPFGILTGLSAIGLNHFSTFSPTFLIPFRSLNLLLCLFSLFSFSPARPEKTLWSFGRSKCSRVKPFLSFFSYLSHPFQLSQPSSLPVQPLLLLISQTSKNSLEFWLV